MKLDGRDPQAIAQAVAALRAGQAIGLPTETVYGLAANAEDPLAVAGVFALKGRPSDHPLIVHVAQASDVAHFTREPPDFARRLMASFWPGPLTLILPRRADVAAAAAGGQDSVGLRCPSHPVAQALLRASAAAGMPGLAAPSANKFGRISPTTADHVLAEFGDGLLVLDGGACEVGIESTIIDCTRGQPVLLRPGRLTRAQLEAAAGLPLRDAQELAQDQPRASGTLEVHYAPRAKLRLMDAGSMQKALDLLGSDIDRVAGSTGGKDLQPAIATYSRAVLASRSATLLRRRMPDDATEAARQLFAVLRSFDDQGVKLIWVETPPDTPEWDGVRDRLQRAAAA